MASPEETKKNNGNKAPEKKTWIEDERSLPTYRALESHCNGKVAQGYLVDAVILGKIDDEGKDRRFMALVMKLTEDCPAFADDEPIMVKAGKEIFIHGAELRDLDKIALDPKHVFEYQLQPTGKKKKLTSGYSMPLWKRMRNPVPALRSDICPNRTHLLTPGVIAKQLTEGGDATFNTAGME